MDYKERFLDRFNETFGLPPEIILKLPLIMMVGDKSLILENHQGILEYNRERIRIRLIKGELTLLGQNMLVRNISHEEIQIKGELTGLTFNQGGPVND